jgi:hypothetical protein
MNRIFILIFLVTLLPLSVPSAAVDLAFLKGGDLYFHPDQSSLARKIGSGGDDQIIPRWSPDGQHILFAKSAYHSGGLQALILTSLGREGRIESKMSIGFGDLPDVRLAGVRWVKDIGWLGQDKIFVIGDVNPRIDELRIFNLKTGIEIEGQFGSLFAICRKIDRLAFLQLIDADHLAPTVFVGNSMSAAPLNIQGHFRMMFWDINCRRLFAIETEDFRSTLRVIFGENHGQTITISNHPALSVELMGDIAAIHSLNRSTAYVRLSTMGIISNPDDTALLPMQNKTTLEKYNGIIMSDWFPF